MDKYEVVVVLDATLSQEQKEAIVKETLDSISKCDGKLINSQVWLDKHRMSFRLKKCSEGTYYLLNYEMSRPANAKFRELMRLNEKVLRSLIVRVE